jgi:hypothetical protein
MTQMPSQRFSGSGFDFLTGQSAAAAWLASTSERRGPVGRAVTTSPAPGSGRPRSTAAETAARQIHADACRLYADGRYTQARMKLLRLVGGEVLADEGHYGLACIAAVGGDVRTARSHLLRALALNPRHRNAGTALARLRR